MARECITAAFEHRDGSLDFGVWGSTPLQRQAVADLPDRLAILVAALEGLRGA